MNKLIAYIEGISGLRGWPLLKRGVGLVVLALGPSYLVSYLAVKFLPPQDRTDPLSSVTSLLLGISVGPLAETYLMRLFLFGLRKIIRNKVVLCVCVALMFGGLHGFQGWGLYAIWPFFVLGVCYLKWEEVSVREAMIGTTLLHIALNSVGVWAYVAQRVFSS